MHIIKYILIFLAVITIYTPAQDSLFNNIKWFIPYERDSYDLLDSLRIDMKEFWNVDGYINIKNNYDNSHFTSLSLSNKDSVIRNVDTEHASKFFNAGIVNINGSNELFLWGYDGGNGRCPGRTNILYLYNPRSDIMISLAISFFGCPFLPMRLDWSNNSDKPELSKEREFLEGIKYNFEYVDTPYLEKNKENIELAYYYWLSKNNSIDTGKLTIQQYFTETDPFGRQINKMVSDSDYFHIIKDEGKLYFACYDAAVECYDVNKKEFTVLFVMNDGYDPIHIIKKYKNYLLISTWNDHLAMINLKTLQIRRTYEFYVNRSDPLKRGISSMEIKEDCIQINEKQKISLPDF